MSNAEAMEAGALSAWERQQDPARAVTALLLHEMLSGAVAQDLRARGVDTVAVVDDLALIGTPDENLLAHAVTQHRVLVTVNIDDFAAIANAWHAAGRETPA